MDYDAFERQQPKKPGETEEQWRLRLTQDGLVRFATSAVLKDVLKYKEILSNAQAADCPVVRVPDDLPPGFATNTYAPKPDLEAMWHAKNGTGPTTTTMSRADARDVRLLEQREREAALTGRSFAVATETVEDPKSEYDNRYVVITPEIRDNPRLYAEAIQRAASEGKFLRVRAAVLR